MVRSVTTLATPHHGSYLATWGIEQIGVRMKLMDVLKYLSVPYDAFLQLTPEYCKEEFNPRTRDHPQVSYFSYGANKDLAMVNPMYFFHRLLLEAEGPNDGFVSVSSAKWGEYLGTLPCDHMEMINWSPYYDASPLYLEIASALTQHETEIEVRSSHA